ncbi:hypothetical protein L2E82_31485 [Cichorium intybus]|uniref:Uncharacterized protein n=1 Tax=Cichorium intybus TaxID=13427 RepID=A0ACB9BG16_CICIN|nr:hypothetical protein L2E82_31485 [Cichorium intybus]
MWNGVPSELVCNLTLGIFVNSITNPSLFKHVVTSDQDALNLGCSRGIFDHTPILYPAFYGFSSEICAVVVNPSIEVAELGENDGDFLLLTQRLGAKIEDGKKIYALMAQNEELARKVEVLEKMEYDSERYLIQVDDHIIHMLLAQLMASSAPSDNFQLPPDKVGASQLSNSYAKEVKCVLKELVEIIYMVVLGSGEMVLDLLNVLLMPSTTTAAAVPPPPLPPPPPPPPPLPLRRRRHHHHYTIP